MQGLGELLKMLSGGGQMAPQAGVPVTSQPRPQYPQQQPQQMSPGMPVDPGMQMLMKMGL